MAVTILEALQAADYNLQSNHGLGMAIAGSQVHNAVTLLEKGYGLNDEVEPLIEKHGGIDNVPEKESSNDN